MADRRRTVLLTRPGDGADDFTRVLAEHGIDVIHEPLIGYEEPQSWTDVDKAIASIHSFNGLIFTSAQAVRAFLPRALKTRKKETLPPMHVVGMKTGRALEEFGLSAATINETGGARELVETLGVIEGKRFLHPSSNIARDELQEEIDERGGHVRLLVVYRTIGASDETAKRIRSLMQSGAVGCVAFLSPSAVGEFFRITGSMRMSALFAAIGSTTGEAIIQAGASVDIIAPSQSAEALADAIGTTLHGKASPLSKGD